MADLRESYRLRWIKIGCGILLAIAFWFAVPYSFPLQLDADPLKAAADEATAYGGNLSRQIALPVVLLISCYMLWRLPKTAHFTRPSKLLMCGASYMAWAIASTAWSTDVSITRKRLVVLCINVLLTYALARCASMMDLALLGFASCGSVAVLAFIADAMMLHTFAPFDPDYRFMGVMTANFQAMNLVVCLLCGVTVLQRRLRWSAWLLPLLIVFALLLFLTRARVGTLLCVAMLAAVFVRLARSRLPPQGRVLLLLCVMVAAAAGAGLVIARSGTDAVTQILMMGRKDTENTASLSNRAPLWGELMESVKQHPILGFGFEAFWSPERVEKISVDQGWLVPHAHNTYLDQVLSLGIVGAVLYTGTLVGGCVVGWRRYREQRNETSLLPAMLLTWLALLSLSESIPVAPNLPALIAYTCLLKMGCQDDDHESSTAAFYAAGLLRIRSRYAPPVVNPRGVHN